MSLVKYRKIHLLSRPPDFRLNPSSPLYRDLLFAGLGNSAGNLFYSNSVNYNNDGALTSMPASKWEWSNYLNRWCLNFDGISNRINVTLVAPSTNRCTFACFERMGTRYQYRGLLFSRNVLCGLLTLGPAPKDLSVGYMWAGTPDEYNATTNMTMNDNEWNLVACVIEPTAATIYRYGQSGYGSWINSKTHTAKSIAGLYEFGYDNNNSTRFWSGYLTDFFIWNRAVTSDELLRISEPNNTMLVVDDIPLILPPRRCIFPSSNITIANNYASIMYTYYKRHRV